MIFLSYGNLSFPSPRFYGENFFSAFHGVSGDHLLFDVMLEQPDAKRAYFFITDGNGNKMHAESVLGKSVLKRVMISAYESDRLIFNYSAGKGEVKKHVDVKVRNQQSVEVNWNVLHCSGCDIRFAGDNNIDQVPHFHGELF